MIRKYLGLLLLLFSSSSFASSIVVNPFSVTANQTGVVLAITGTGTTFAGTPFTASGGTLVITAQNVISTTSATITVNTGISINSGVTISDFNGDTYLISVFNVQHTSNANSLAAVTPTVAAGSLDSGALADNCPTACWGNSLGGVILNGITTPGSYTVAPNVTYIAPIGTFPNHVTATATASLSAGGIASPLTITNTGYDYTIGTAPTFSGGTGSGGVAAVPTISNKLFKTLAAGSCSYGNFGSQCWLLFGSALTTLNQQVETTYLYSASTDDPSLVARVNTGTKQLYNCQVAATTGIITCFYFNNYSGGAATTVVSTASLAPVVGHEYIFRMAVTGSSPSTVHVSLYDNNTSTYIANAFANDSSAGVQSAGQVGGGYVGTRQSLETLIAYNQVMTCTPASVNLNVNGQSVLCTELGASFTAGTPGSPAFTNTGSTSGCVLNSQVVNSTTQVTLNFNNGATPGTCLVNDPNSGLSGSFAVVPISSPNAITSSIPNTSVLISASGAATFANFPATYKLYKSQKVNFNPATDTSAILVSTQSGVAVSVTPTAVTDSSPLAGTYFYVWQVTDTSSQIGYGLESSVLAFYANTKGNIGVVCDSICAGHFSDVLIQRIMDPVITNAGTGYTSNPTCPVVGGGSGALGGHITVVESGGLIIYAFPDDQPFEYGFTSENVPATCTVTGGGGSGGIITLNSGGGWPLALEQILQNQYGLKGIHVIQAARGGTAVSSFQCGSTLMNRALAQFVSPAVTPYVAEAFGANDANGNTSQAQYISYYQNNLTCLTAAGYKVILIPPMYNGAASQAANALIQQYVQAIPTLVSQYPGKVFEAGANIWDWSVAHGNFFFDKLHLNGAGAGTYAGTVAPDFARITGTNPPGGGSGSTMLILRTQ